MKPRQRGRNARLRRAIGVVWTVMWERAKREAMYQRAQGGRAHQRRGPDDSRARHRPDLEQRILPRARPNRHAIPDPDFARAVCEYLYNQLAEVKRRNVSANRRAIR